MKNYYREFQSFCQTELIKLEQIFTAKINKARDKEAAYQLQLNDMYQFHKNLQRELSPHNRFLIEIKEEYDLDNTKEIEKIFNHKWRLFSQAVRKKIFKNLVLLQTYENFFSCLREKELNKSSNEIEDFTIQSNITWIGKNETEFVQLIYALYEANLIQGEGITKIAKEFARLLNFELKSNWQSNHSKSLNERNADYEPKIFANLSKAYNEYRKKRIYKEK